ncbi:hypothetical protein [Parabacteroides sp. AM08-6]|uniref:hypothetical protein n=2 Tax=Parabacteroides sp. AM08-6 TaxID=2292053 RepID=UPI000F00A116|nr:hypothetical protein [Parabacteroides sp. AM08-6]RHJ74986.1 hypothetical protein DW103_17745 [Parabacteroides sp. AM08-6]
MKKKRYIMQDTAITTYTAPVVLVEEYNRQIQEFGFKDKQEVLTYLAVGLCNERNGIKNSWIVRGILSRVSVERPPVLRIFPRTYMGIQIRGEYKDKILSLSDFGYLSNLMNAVMEAFLAAGRTEKRRLRKEMHARFVPDVPGSEWLQTYISNTQYDKLFEMAIHGGMSITGMVRSAIGLVLAAEYVLPDACPVPYEVQEAIQGRLRIEGFTTHRFSREVQFRMYVGNDGVRDGIYRLIQRYQIPGTSEFLRRVLLFLLESKSIGFRYIPEESDFSESDYFDDNEMYYNERLSRKDFVRSIYQ